MKDLVPMKVGDAVTFVNHDQAHPALVTRIHSKDSIELVYINTDDSGNSRLWIETEVQYKIPGSVVPPYWWVPEIP